MKKTQILFFFLLQINLVIGQGKLNLIQENKISSIDQHFNDYEVYALNFNQLNTNKQQTDIQFTFNPSGQNWNISLQKNDMRGPNFKLKQITDNGIFETSNINITTYKGEILGKPNSSVRLSVNQIGQLTGYFNDGTTTWYIEPVPTNYNKSINSHLFFNVADTKSKQHTCGSPDMNFKPQIEQQVNEQLQKGNNNCLVLDLALDADYEYYQKHGTSTVETILGIMNEVEGVYNSTFGLTIEIPSLIVWQTSDPYPDTVLTSGFILSQLRNYYETNMTSLERDLTHQFTGKQMDGVSVGIAFTNSYCSLPHFAYGVSQNIGDFAYGRYVLTAHEIGHNLGAQHGDSENCSSTGSIMCAGVQLGAFYFGQNEINAINMKLNASTSCIMGYCNPLEIDTISVDCSDVTICWTNTGTTTDIAFQWREEANYVVGGWLTWSAPIVTSTNCITRKLSDGNYQFRIRENLNPNQNEYYTNTFYQHIATTPAPPTVNSVLNNCLEDATITWNNNGQPCDVLIKGPDYFYYEANTMNTSAIAASLEPGEYYALVKYSCASSGGAGTRFEIGTKVDFDIKVLLEGPYELQDDSMRTSLQQLNVLEAIEDDPNHPYNRPPWNYLGLEGIAQDSYLPENSVDWILLSFRAAPADGSVPNRSFELFRKAGMLLSDGSVVFPVRDSETSIDYDEDYIYFPNCHLNSAGGVPDVFIMVEHRNHLPILSPVAIPTINNVMTFDFSTQNSHNNNGAIAGQKNLGTTTQPKYVLYGGNGKNVIVPDEYYDINGPDKSVWSVDNGTFGFYLDTDYNLDGDVSGPDKTLWFKNNGTFTLFD